MNFKSILELDASLSRQIRVAEKPGLLRNIAILFAHSGDSWFWGLALILLWFLGQTFWKDWSIIEFAGIALLVIIVMAVKFTVRRRRPEGEWGGIYRNTDPHSFPSGHAARAFLIATIATVIGPGWLAIILCIWAPLVALARVAMGVHYVSDIVVGAILGVLVALVGLQFTGWILATAHSLLGIFF